MYCIILVITIDSNMEKAKEFVEKLQMVHQIVQYQLEKVKGKYTKRQDKNHGDHKFQFSYQWIEIGKLRDYTLTC